MTMRKGLPVAIAVGLLGLFAAVLSGATPKDDDGPDPPAPPKPPDPPAPPMPPKPPKPPPQADAVAAMDIAWPAMAVDVAGLADAPPGDVKRFADEFARWGRWRAQVGDPAVIFAPGVYEETLARRLAEIRAWRVWYKAQTGHAATGPDL